MHTVGAWGLNISVGLEVQAVTPPTSWAGYVNGTREILTTGYNHYLIIYAWDEWNSPSSTCDPNTHTDVAFSGWQFRSGSTWYYMTSPDTHVVGPSICMLLGDFFVTHHGFDVFE